MKRTILHALAQSVLLLLCFSNVAMPASFFETSQQEPKANASPPEAQAPTPPPAPTPNQPAHPTPPQATSPTPAQTPVRPGPDNTPPPQPLAKPKKTTPAAAPSRPADQAPAAAPSAPAPSTLGPVRNLSAIREGTWEVFWAFMAKKTDANGIAPQMLADWAATHECNRWARNKDNEFEMRDLMAKAQKSLDTMVLPSRIFVTMQAQLGDYNFAENGFAIFKADSKYAVGVDLNITCGNFHIGDRRNGFPSKIEIKMNKPAAWKPVLPLNQQAGKELLQTLGGARMITAVLVLDLIDIDRRNGPRVEALLANPVAIFFWQDKSKRKFLGALGDYVPGAEAK